MRNLSTGQAFKQLPRAEQQRYRDIVGELMASAQEHAIPMCFAPPLVTADVPLRGGWGGNYQAPPDAWQDRRSERLRAANADRLLLHYRRARTPFIRRTDPRKRASQLAD